MVMGSMVWSRLAALGSLVASVGCVVGVVTVGWLQADILDSHVGLWTECVMGGCTTLLLRLDVGDWLITCQGLSITALLCSLLTLGLAGFVAKTSRDSSPAAIYGVLATSLFTGVTIAVTIVIYYVQYPLRYPRPTYTPSYSFFLVLAAGGMHLIQAVTLACCCVIMRCRHHPTS